MKWPSFQLTRKMQLLLFLGLLVIVAIVWYSLNFAASHRLIHNVEIKIVPEKGVNFIDENEVNKIISQTIGNPLEKNAKEINLTLLESKFKKIPAIKSAQVFIGLEGNLKIQIEQRIPIIRITNLIGETFFLDSSGFKIPQKLGYSPDVIIANGNITEKFSDSNRIKSVALQNCLQVSKFLFNDKQWDAQFTQLYVDNFNDLILVSRIGHFSIVVGNAEDLSEKFQNLKAMLVSGMPKVGWDKYKTLNLKFKGQVVGETGKPVIENKKEESVQNTKHN